MIAHLPMYDVPGNRAAHDALWSALQDCLTDAPHRTIPGDLMKDWIDPNLFLSQTCGLPYRSKLHGKVQLIGTADNKIENCPAGYYQSVIVARRGSDPDLGANDFTLAYNEPLSQSGWAAPHSIGVTGKTRKQSGGHAKSAEMVVSGQADVAAIDALTWHFLIRDWHGAAGLKVIARTPPTPTLPYITSRGQNADLLHQAFAQAILEIGAAHRETLQLFGLVDLPAPAYLAEPLPPAP